MNSVTASRLGLLVAALTISAPAALRGVQCPDGSPPPCRVRPLPSPRVVANRLAVLPFSVSGGAGVASLGQGMVDLLSRSLDEAEGLRTIDPGTVVTIAGRHGGSVPLDAGTGRGIAHRLGAGLYVLGSVHMIGRQLRIQARLYDEANVAAGPQAQGSVEGDTTQLFELVDRLSAQLLLARRRGPALLRAPTAALTTHSLPALKIYLDAERALRAGKVDSAIAGFERAGVEDSTFALAHYRLAVSAVWQGPGLPAPRWALAEAAAQRAVAFADRLSARDRRLLAAYALYFRGAADSAEREYRGILADYPDDLDAEFELGNLLHHYNPLRGRPRAETRELFDRVLALDPGFL